MPVRYFPAARRDIKDALRWSWENFGEQAVLRYKKLLGVAIAEIAANPMLTHSYEIPGLQEGVRLYHLRHSRKRAAVDGVMVKSPRHFIACTILSGETVIVRVLHERMEIARQFEELPQR